MKYNHRISSVALIFLIAAVAIALPRQTRAALVVPLAGAAIVGVVILVMAWAGLGREKKRPPWSH